MKGKQNYFRTLPHLLQDGHPVFVTFDTAHRWILSPPARDLVLASCLHDHDIKLRMYASVVMPEHLHLLFLPLKNEKGELYTFAETVGAIKSASAHTLNKPLKRHGQVWQAESYDRVPRTSVAVAKVVRYIELNPVRRGLVKKPADYKWLWINRELY